MISLTHLKYFFDAATLGGVGPAAKRNRVSPSAVSQAIKSLETHFERNFLEHSKNRFVLTLHGKALAEHCQTVFLATENLEEKMRPSSGAPKGEVIFATQQSIANNILPGFLKQFIQKYPAVEIKLKIGTTDSVKQWLDEREIEFGINVDNFGEHDFISLPIYQGEYVFVAPKKWRVRPVEEQSFILPGPTTRESKTFKNNYLNKFKKQAPVILEVKSWTVVKKFAEIGLGIGLLPDFVFKFDPFHALKTVDFGLPPIGYSICADYPHRRHKLSRQSQLFLDGFKDYLTHLPNP